MPDMPDTDLAVLLDGMRQRFALIDRQLMGLQADITGYSVRARREHAPPAPHPQQPPRPMPPAPVARARFQPRPAAPRRPGWFERQTAAAGAGNRRQRGELNLSDFLGLPALAWIGGVITLLGILFFYVLADQRGWVGPGGRVLLGTAISTGLLVLAYWLRHLRGRPEAALAAAGTGIAGLYVTLFAATKLYDYLPTAVGMPLALAIAALAIVWHVPGRPVAGAARADRSRAGAADGRRWHLDGRRRLRRHRARGCTGAVDRARLEHRGRCDQRRDRASAGVAGSGAGRSGALHRLERALADGDRHRRLLGRVPGGRFRPSASVRVGPLDRATLVAVRVDLNVGAGR